MKWMSEAQIPHANDRTRICPRPGVGSSVSRASTTPPRSTAARMRSSHARSRFTGDCIPELCPAKGPHSCRAAERCAQVLDAVDEARLQSHGFIDGFDVRKVAEEFTEHHGD